MRTYLVTEFTPAVRPTDNRPPHKQLERYLDGVDPSWELKSIVPVGDVWGARYMITFVGEDDDA